MKELKNSLAAIIILMTHWASAQNDPAPYTLFKDKIVFYTDLGYTSAPFSIHYNFLESIDKLKFKNNYRTVLGFGGSYKWFAMRIAFPLPGNMTKCRNI